MCRGVHHREVKKMTVMPSTMALASILALAAAPPEGSSAGRREALKAAADKEFSYGNLRKALELSEAACTISRETPGEESPEHSDDLSHLARIQLELDDMEGCIATIEKVAAIRHKAEADRPWRIAEALDSLRYFRRMKAMTPDEHALLRAASLAFRDAKMKERVGDIPAAIDLAARGIEQRRKAIRYINKPLAEEILLQSGRYARLGRYDKADLLFNQGLEAFEELYGKVSRDRSAALQFRAATYRGRDLDLAIAAQREAAEGYLKVLGHEADVTRKSWQILAAMYRERAERENASGKIARSPESYRLESWAHEAAGEPAWKSREALALAEQWRRYGSLDRALLAQVDSAIDAAEKFAGTEGLAGAATALETLDRLVGRGSQASLVLARKIATALGKSDKEDDRVEAAYRDLIDRLARERGPGHPALSDAVEQWAGTLSHRGDLLETADKPAEAAAFYERAEALLGKYLGTTHHRARSLHADLERAKALAWATPEDRRAIRESFEAMRRCDLLADRNQLAEALATARAALEARRRVLGSPSRDVGFSENSIGFLYERMSSFADAEEHYQAALANYGPTLGEVHPDCAMVWHNLGVMYRTSSRQDLCHAAFRKAIDISRATLGADHPRYARELVGLAGLAIGNRDAVEATSLLDEALVILEKADLSYREELARAYNGLAAVYQGTGKVTDAEALFRKAIAAWKEAGLEVDRAITLDNLAILLMRQGRLADADSLSSEAVAVLEKLRGKGDDLTVMTKGNRANLLNQLGRRLEAAALLEQNLDASFALFEASALGASERDAFMALIVRRTLLDAYLTLALPRQASAADVYRRVVR
jgi:tetratricopeptide (TPR) repeat protein